MAPFPVATGARLLGIHPKTLRHWLKAAEFPLAAHPPDARLKCVAEEPLLVLARQHGRPLPDLSSARALDGYAASSLVEHQLEQRLHPLEGSVPQSHESLLAFSQTSRADLLAPSPPPAHRPLPAEVRARSRVTALIEYGAQGQSVAVCPKLGVLALIPDSSGRFSACRASHRGQYTRCWAARRCVHGHDFWHSLGVTDRLTLALLEQAAAALQARVDAL